jgi:hypothetical protein
MLCHGCKYANPVKSKIEIRTSQIKKGGSSGASFLLVRVNPDYFLAALMADCAAESLAMGTLKGEQLT